MKITPFEACVARYSKKDLRPQPLSSHLKGVGEYSGLFGEKIGMKKTGILSGLLHDLGKVSEEFQKYIGDITGFNGAEKKIDAEKQRKISRVDHSTAGGKLINEMACDLFLSSPKLRTDFTHKLIAMAIFSHHGRGLKNFLTASESPFDQRISKDVGFPEVKKVYGTERIVEMEALYFESAQELIGLAREFNADFKERILNMSGASDLAKLSVKKEYLLSYYYTARMLQSMVIDSDRIDSAAFETPIIHRFRQRPDWERILKLLEENYAKFPKNSESKVDNSRNYIYSQCENESSRKPGFYTLTAPTGSGKTLAYLIYAVKHCIANNLDRIIISLPFISIITQAADVIRKIVGDENVLEDHSLFNEPPGTNSMDSWRKSFLAETWESPIIVTTNVQILDSIYGSTGSSVRHAHRLNNSLIIFDEVQSIPSKMLYLFNAMSNFLVRHGKSSVLLCTATQPSFEKLNYFPTRLSGGSELVVNDQRIMDAFKRVIVENKMPANDYAFNTLSSVVSMATEGVKNYGNLLMIVNTKNAARMLYSAIQSKEPELDVFCLTTNMCNKHRNDVLSKVKENLKDKKPVACISTQLIEAGVDIDFSFVIRSLAGMDSIAQAAGRCNRHGLRDVGYLYIVRLPTGPNMVENLDVLPEIREAQVSTRRVLKESVGKDLLSQEVMDLYYYYHFKYKERETSNMAYPGIEIVAGSERDNAINLLTGHCSFIRSAHGRSGPEHFADSSWGIVNQAFRVVDNDQSRVYVEYDEHAKNLINELKCKIPENDNANVPRIIEIKRELSKYSINIFRNVLDPLVQNGGVIEISGDDENPFFVLDSSLYNPHHGFDQ